MVHVLARLDQSCFQCGPRAKKSCPPLILMYLFRGPFVPRLMFWDSQMSNSRKFSDQNYDRCE
jgi:hypothetical protein